MRSCQTLFWGCVVLATAIAGCGGMSDGQPEMPAAEAMAPLEDTSADSMPQIETASEVPVTVEPATSAADIPATVAAEPETAALNTPGSLASSGNVTSIFSTTPAAPASSANDWPTLASRHQPAESRAMTAAPHADPSPPPAASVIQVDEIVSRLDYGTVGFYTPDELPWGKTFVQEVVLSPKDTPEQLRTALSDPTAPAEFSRLQVAGRMEAKLTGKGFEIEPLSEPLQAITSHRPTKWRFNVTPVASGPQELHLSLLAHIDVDGRDSALVVETKDARIDVDITVPQRLAGMVSANWQWLWAAVIVPLIGFCYRRKSGRVRREPPVHHARAA